MFGSTHSLMERLVKNGLGYMLLQAGLTEYHSEVDPDFDNSPFNQLLDSAVSTDSSDDSGVDDFDDFGSYNFVESDGLLEVHPSDCNCMYCSWQHSQLM